MGQVALKNARANFFGNRAGQTAIVSHDPNYYIFWVGVCVGWGVAHGCQITDPNHDTPFPHGRVMAHLVGGLPNGMSSSPIWQ